MSNQTAAVCSVQRQQEHPERFLLSGVGLGLGGVVEGGYVI